MRRLLILACLLWAVPVSAQVTFDAATATTATAQASLTFSHTTGGGSNRVLAVVIPAWSSTEGNSLPSGVTYNGVAMTLIINALDNGNRVTIWGLSAPASGAHNVVVTFAGTVDEISAYAITVTGAHQTTALAFNTAAQNAGAVTGTASVTVTSDTNEFVIDGVYLNASAAPSAAGGQTERLNNVIVTGSYGLGSSAAGAAPNVTMSWNLAGTVGGWVAAGVSIKEPGGAPPPSGHRALLLGVGDVW
jgi:hypothetical protein